MGHRARYGCPTNRLNRRNVSRIKDQNKKVYLTRSDSKVEGIRMKIEAGGTTQVLLMFDTIDRSLLQLSGRAMHVDDAGSWKGDIVKCCGSASREVAKSTQILVA